MSKSEETRRRPIHAPPLRFRKQFESMSNEEFNRHMNKYKRLPPRLAEFKLRQDLQNLHGPEHYASFIRYPNRHNPEDRNSLRQTRSNRMTKLYRKLLDNQRVKRAATAAATGINEVAATALANNQGYTLGSPNGAPSARQLENAERKARNAARPPGAGPLRPAVPSGSKGVTTFANLAKKEGKQVFINISFVPAEGVRNYTQGTQAETIIEKKQVPLLIQNDVQKGPTFLAEMTSSSGQVQYIIIPSVIPSIKGGKMVAVPLSQASPVLDSQREPKKQLIQHTYQKKNVGIFSVSYEATIYKDSNGDSFFYYLNLPEITDGGNNGLVMYDAPFLPPEFISEKR